MVQEPYIFTDKLSSIFCLKTIQNVIGRHSPFHTLCSFCKVLAYLLSSCSICLLTCYCCIYYHGSHKSTFCIGYYGFDKNDIFIGFVLADGQLLSANSSFLVPWKDNSSHIYLLDAPSILKLYYYTEVELLDFWDDCVYSGISFCGRLFGAIE